MPGIWVESAKMERAEWQGARDATKLLTEGCQERSPIEVLLCL